MSRTNETITLTCTETRKIALEAIAANLGYLWGGNPNISALLAAIADGEVPIGDQAIAQALRDIATARHALGVKSS